MCLHKCYGVVVPDSLQPVDCSHEVPPSMEFSVKYCSVAMSFSRIFSTQESKPTTALGGQILYHCTNWDGHVHIAAFKMDNLKDL